jgi:hypothetical protein
MATGLQRDGGRFHGNCLLMSDGCSMGGEFRCWGSIGVGILVFRTLMKAFGTAAALSFRVA